VTPVTIDFETYWSSTYTLSKVDFVRYIHSPEFEVISASIKIGSGPTECCWGADEVDKRLREIDWTTHACVAHNGNEFDFPLLVWNYDLHPKLFIDTLCLARPKHQSSTGVGLEPLSTYYGYPNKDKSILRSTQGKRGHEFDLREIVLMTNYNITDSDNTYKLLMELLPDTPKIELLHSDMTARMICYPQFKADIKLLTEQWIEVVTTKQKSLDALALKLNALDAEDVRATMASGPKFAEALRVLGVEPPTKISKKTGKEAFAFAKTDPGFLALLDHEDMLVQDLASCRLGIKSTLLETRLLKMADCAKAMPDNMLPVPLAYHSATTGRWGGRVWNPQNLPRIPRDKSGVPLSKLTNALRMSLRAPSGMKVVVADLSGIELRVNHYLWGVYSTQQLYANDPEADLYKEFAAALYQIPKEQVTKEQRQLAKVAQLGLGFGAGSTTFKTVAKIMGGIDLDDAEALRVTQAWRVKYSDIVKGWKACQQLVKSLYQNTVFSVGVNDIVSSDGNGAVVLPSGRKLYYPDMQLEVDEGGRAQYFYGIGRHKSKVYAGLMCENIVQAIARDVIAEQAVAVRSASGYYPALMVHDELVYVVPEDEAVHHLAVVQGIMRTAPKWLPGIVLWSEGDIADRYGDAK
jgi:hypothetical protein